MAHETIKAVKETVKNGMIVKIPQLPFNNQLGEIYLDTNGVADVYVPETSEHTSFNLKLPNGYAIKFVNGQYPEIVF